MLWEVKIDMKLYFMKQEALETIKSNLPILYKKYYEESDNNWIYEICGADPFVEFATVPDFSLTNLDSGYTPGEIEFNNCKIIYENLKFLTESQASDERLWAGLCHTVYYEYLRQRFEYDKTNPEGKATEISAIKSRFFFTGGTRAGCFRNSISKCWWVGRATYDSTFENHFEKLDIIGSNDISTKISDIFYSNTFSSNSEVLDGIVEGIRTLRENEIKINAKDHIRPTMKMLNIIGGGIVLDYLTSDEITNIFVKNVKDILDGVNQGIAFTEDEIENEDELQSEDGRILIDSMVILKNVNTGSETVHKVSISPATKEMPPLIKKIVGKFIGEEIEFEGDTYKIERFA